MTSKQTLKFLTSILIFLMLTGCTEAEKEDKKAYLIKVGETLISEDEFESAFEFDKSAYSYDAVHNPTILKGLRLQFLKEISERLTLLERARELGIQISEPELEAAAAGMKKGYPEGEFEKALLESVVSYNSWKKELKVRLIMEKVVEKDLASGITIHPDEIKEYYKKHFKQKKSDDKSQEINQIITERLKRYKTEAAYEDWVKKLQDKYKIEINESEWEKITGS